MAADRLPLSSRIDLPERVLPAVGSGALARLRARLRHRRQRRALAELDDRLLRDIGVSRADARAASRRLL